MKASQKYFYVPEQAVHSLKESLSEKDFEKHNQKFLYLLHKISEEYLFNWRYEKGDFVNLKYEYLREIIGDTKYKFTDGKKLIDFVLTHWKNSGWLICDNHFIRGKKSYGYKFTDQVKHYPLRQYMLTDDILERRLSKHSAKDFEPTIPYLCAAKMHFNSIRIRENEAYNYIENKYDITVNDYNSGLLKDIADVDLNFAERYKHFESDYHSIKAIASGILQFERSSKNKRIHSNITNLNSELRPFLYIEGYSERLYSIDARNSQPFLFNTLIDQFCKEQGIEYRDHKDLELYKQLTSTGKFYEYFAKLVGFKLTDENRRDFKEEVFSKLFYCKQRDYKYQRIFGKHFSQVKIIIDFYKEKYGNDGLAIMMQVVEAEIFIDEIVKRIYEKNKNTFFLTLHDSIICLESDKQAIMDICNEVFREKGFFPTMSDEIFCENNCPEELPDIPVESAINNSEATQNIQNISTKVIEEVRTEVLDEPEIGDYDSDKETVEDSTTTISDEIILTVKQKQEFEKFIENCGFTLFWVQTTLFLRKDVSYTSVMDRLHSSRDEVFTIAEINALRDIMLKAIKNKKVLAA